MSALRWVRTNLVMILGLGVLIRIDPLLTLAVFVPLVLVLAVVNMASKRIQKYRRAARYPWLPVPPDPPPPE